MKYSVGVPAELNRQLLDHLIRKDGQEDAAFSLWMPSLGVCRYTALLNEFIHPLPQERSVRGNVTVSQEYFLRASNLTLNRNAGLVLMHSHV